MDIEFNCSKCGQRLVVNEKLAGTSVDCPKCQVNLSVPYKFQCSACSFKSYRDFSRCPKCRGVGPGLLGDKVTLHLFMRRLSFILIIALVLASFLLIFVGSQVVKAKKVRIEKKLAIAKELIVKGENLKAWEGLEKLQVTAHKVKFKEEEIKQTIEGLKPKVKAIRRKKWLAEEGKKKALKAAKETTGISLDRDLENAGIGILWARMGREVGSNSYITVSSWLSDDRIKYAVQYALMKYREKYPGNFTTVFCYDTNNVFRAKGSMSLLGGIKVTQ